MSNKISLYGALKVNGLVVDYSKPILVDVSSDNLLYVLPAQTQNFGSDDLIPAWQLTLENPNGLTANVYYLQKTSDTETIAEFLTALSSSDTTFVNYSNLEKINGKEVATSGQNILVNDKFMNSRTYVPSANNTVIKVNCKNFLSPTVFTVDGNQTIAGAYTYFGA